jgi:hypothetical protein
MSKVKELSQSKIPVTCAVHCHRVSNKREIVFRRRTFKCFYGLVNEMFKIKFCPHSEIGIVSISGVMHSHLSRISEWIWPVCGVLYIVTEILSIREISRIIQR